MSHLVRVSGVGRVGRDSPGIYLFGLLSSSCIILWTSRFSIILIHIPFIVLLFITFNLFDCKIYYISYNNDSLMADYCHSPQL